MALRLGLAPALTQIPLSSIVLTTLRSLEITAKNNTSVDLRNENLSLNFGENCKYLRRNRAVRLC
jgi:hypothetical protein